MTDNMLSLCDPHNSIIHEFGCDMNCLKPAAVCIRGCSQHDHRQKSSKHEFMQSRQVYAMVGQIRQSYKVFESDFKEVYLRRYIQRLKQAIDLFEYEIIQTFCINHPLSQLFGKNSDESIHTILQDQQEDIEYSQLKCKDIHQIRQFSNSLLKDAALEQQKKIIKIFTKLLEDHLRNLKFIAPLPKLSEKRSKKQQIIEETTITAINESINKRLVMVQNNQKKFCDQLAIKLKDNPQTTESQTDIINFINLQRSLIEKLRPANFTFAFRGTVSTSPFWIKFFESLKGASLEQVRIMITQPPLLKDLQQIEERNEKNLVCVKWQLHNWQKFPQTFLLNL